MKVLQIILEVERAFDIELDDEVTFRVETIGQFESEVERLRARIPEHI
jgi:acyl carrier protein